MLKIFLPSGAFHLIRTTANGEPEIGNYTSSVNTQAALQAAYDAGDWEPYTPPEPEPAPPEPNWSEFRLTLMVHPGFRDWAVTLPADWREDLKLAALATNATALQGIYDHLVTYYPPPPAAAAEWQAIASTNHIPVVFSDV